jgi:hypothetical protein
MKKTVLYGIIALLSVSLFFLGCDTGTSSDGSTVNTPSWPWTEGTGGGGGNKHAEAAQAAQALANLLGGGATANGPVVTIPAGGLDLPVGASVTIPADVTLQVEGDFTVAGELVIEGDLALAPGTTLTVEGTVTATGEVTVPATAVLDVPAGGEIAVEHGGVLTFEAGATGALNGTITVESGATLADLNDGGGSLWTGSAVGEYVYKAGATIVVYSGGNPVTRIGGSGATIELENGATVTLKDGEMLLTGNATLKAQYGIAEANILTIGANSQLTVQLSVGEYFYVNDTAQILGADAGTSKIVLMGNPGDPIIKIKENSGSETNNFYKSDNSEVASTTVDDCFEITPDTYTWDGNADGTGVAGWLGLLP